MFTPYFPLSFASMAALSTANPAVPGEFAPTGVALDAAISSGTVAEVMTTSAFTDR